MIGWIKSRSWADCHKFINEHNDELVREVLKYYNSDLLNQIACFSQLYSDSLVFLALRMIHRHPLSLSDTYNGYTALKMDLEMQTLKDQNSKARDMIKDAKKSAKQMERDAKEARKRDKEEAEKGLLEGWRAFRDEKSGKFYYTIMATGQWTWVKPVVENNTVTETTVVGVDDGQSAELRDQFNACNEIQNVLRLTPKDISSTPFRILLQQHLPKHFIELMERRDKEAVRKREDLKAKKEREQVAAREKKERDEVAAMKSQELRKGVSRRGREKKAGAEGKA